MVCVVMYLCACLLTDSDLLSEFKLTEHCFIGRCSEMVLVIGIAGYASLGTRLLCQYNFEHNGSLKAVSVIGNCKINIDSNIKHLWKTVVNNQYTLVEKSLYGRAK